MCATGTVWSAANNGISNLALISLALDPSTRSTLYAGAIGGALFVTIDGGASWTAMSADCRPPTSTPGAEEITPASPAREEGSPVRAVRNARKTVRVLVFLS